MPQAQKVWLKDRQENEIRAGQGGKRGSLQNFYHQLTGPEGAPKLVFLHGVMGFAANWRTIAKAFEDRYQVLVFDQRGHGRSQKPEFGYAPADYAADLFSIVEELRWPKITLVGHSMGGRNAFEFALTHPERLEKLVIEDIGPIKGELGSDMIMRILNTTPVPFVDKRAAKDYFDGPFMETFKDNRRRVALSGYLYANITEDEQKQGVWRFSENAVRASVEQGRTAQRWGELKTLAIPTLLIRGEASTDLTREVFAQMLAENPAIQGVEIPNAGHWVHSDQPALFIEALNRFLSSASV